jgi:hypothetical protein
LNAKSAEQNLSSANHYQEGGRKALGKDAQDASEPCASARVSVYCASPRAAMAKAPWFSSARGKKSFSGA